jgi:Peptidase family S41
MQMLRYTCLLFICLSCTSCLKMLTGGLKNYQNTEPAVEKTSNKYQHDFEYLATLCEQMFPHADSVFPKNERLQLRKEIYQKLNTPSATTLPFMLEATRYLAHFQNQHTYINRNYTFKQVFGYAIFTENNKWILGNVDKTAADSSALGKEIIAINDQPIALWQKKLQEYVFGENEATRFELVRRYAYYNKPEVLQYIGLIQDVSQLKLTLADGTNIHVKSRPAKNAARFGYKIKPIEHPITKYAGRPYHYQFLPSRSVAYFQFNACFDKVVLLDGIKEHVTPIMLPVARGYLNWQFRKKKPSVFVGNSYHPDYPAFKDFLSELFTKIHQNKTDTLVIDLRYNSGGDFVLASQILYYLTNRTDLKDFSTYFYNTPALRFYHPKGYKEFETSYREKYHTVPPPNEVLPDGYLLGKNIFEKIEDKKSIYYIEPNRPIFKGKVIVLADHNTGSAAALLTTLLQDNGIATVIGSSVSNNPTGASAFTAYKLSKTKHEGSIASRYIVRPTPEKGKVQQPDIFLENDLQDFLEGKDRVFEFVLQSNF